MTSAEEEEKEGKHQIQNVVDASFRRRDFTKKRFPSSERIHRSTLEVSTSIEVNVQQQQQQQQQPSDDLFELFEEEKKQMMMI